MKVSTRVFSALMAAAMLSSPGRGAEAPTFQSIVQPYVDEGRVAGIAGVVVYQDHIVGFPVVGYADVATKKPMARDTLFWIASTSKPIQVTALMMLVDDGKVRLDDSVSRYLPGFEPRLAVKAADGTEAMREPRHPLTVRMLLNHTSGLNPNYSSTRAIDGMPLAELVDELAARPLQHEPGSRFFYSDAGVSVASRIVEVVSGKPFEEFLDERLLRPLGMKDTVFIPSEEQLSRLATAYWVPPGKNQLTPVPDELAQPRPRAQLTDRRSRHAPHGGLFSTGGDLAQFARLFLGKGVVDGRRYLSEASVSEMTRNQISAEAAPTVPQLPPGSPDSPTTYGLGWGIGAGGAYFHPGMSSTNIRIDPASGYATIFLPQHGGDATIYEISLRTEEAARKHFAPQK